MDIFSWVPDYLVPFLVVLTVLVFVHELGHYVVARRNGVKVEVFSIGFGPELFGWTDKAETRWKVSAVPLGGYVKMFGEYDLDDDEKRDRPMTPGEQAVSFHHKRVGQRMAIVSAGPAANFLFAIVVLTVMFSAVGAPAPLAGVGEVVEETAAAEAGFLVGDRIVAIDGAEITWFSDLRDVVSRYPGQALDFRVLRNNVEIDIFATPRAHEEPDGSTIGQLGVRPDPQQVGYERHDPFTALWMSVERSAQLVGQIFSYLGQVLVGAESADKLGGPLRIAKMSGEVAQGGFANLVFFAAALSVNLGLINLFPIPMLDGGHMMFYTAEAVRGRPLTQRAQEYGFRFGLILVLLLMIFATWNDLVELKVFAFIKQLVG